MIAKGQGNYEGLSGAGREVFFLLKAKCPTVAADLGVAQHGMVVVRTPGR